jgi:hypothetical protein
MMQPTNSEIKEIKEQIAKRKEDKGAFGGTDTVKDGGDSRLE